jgi:hypothetical protein
MVAAKNSRKCSLAFSPASAMIAGTGSPQGRGGQERRGDEFSGHAPSLFQGVEFEFRHREIFPVVGDERQIFGNADGGDDHVRHVRKGLALRLGPLKKIARETPWLQS